MRVFLKFCVYMLALSSLAALAAEAPDPLAGIPLIAGEVNGHKITREELIRELIGSSGSEALERLVRRKLVEQAARAANVSASDEDIEREFALDKRDLMEELIHTPGASKEQFPIEDIIRARFRMSVDEYKKKVVRQKLLIQRCVAKDYHPSVEELRAVFNNPENRDFFQPPIKYRASHILITPLNPRDFFNSLTYQSSAGQMSQIKRERQRKIDLYRDHKVDLGNAPPVDQLDPAWRRAREKAEKVLGDIRAGVITWDQALREYTQDPHDQRWYDPRAKRWMPSWRQMLKPPLPPGDVGYFHKNGPLVPEFYAAASQLKLGEIGGPVQTPYGYHLIKITDILRQPALTFEECRARVERLSLEKYIQVRSTAWIGALVDSAELKTEKSVLWPPLPSAGMTLDPSGPPPAAPAESDPVVGTINGEKLLRSEVWRELVQSEGDEGLRRLMNREIILTLLEPMGLERMEWECSNPFTRPPEPPPARPITAVQRNGQEMNLRTAVDIQLNDDRIRLEGINQARNTKKQPELSFRDYIFQRYGQSEKDYRRALEAGLVLAEALRRRIPCDDPTLQLFFAMTRDAYSAPDWYEISHILIVPEHGMKDATRLELQQALNDAEQVRRMYEKNPDTWNQLVQLFSKDSAENKAHNGALGACYPDNRPRPGTMQDGGGIPDGPILHRAIVEQRLQSLPGMASTPIRTSRGFHVVRIDKVHPSLPVEFDEIKDQLREDYMQERAKMYTDVWLRALKRTLKKQAAIRNYLGDEPATTDLEDIHALPPDGPLPLPQ